MEALHVAREFLFWATLAGVGLGLVLHQYHIYQAARRDRSAVRGSLPRHAGRER